MKNDNLDNQISIFDLFEEVNNKREVNNKIKKEVKEIIVEEAGEEEHFIGEEVLIDYDGTEYIGNITRIYNEGNTINVCFNNGIAPFYKNCVKKISSSVNYM